MKYLFLILLLVACEGKHGTPVNVEGAKDNFNVTLLFEKDGCKVYRFEDSKFRYFTNCTETTSEYTESCGKGCTRTVEDSNPTGRGK